MICMALELGNPSRTRVRFAVLDAVSCGEMTAAVNRLVAANTTLLLPDHLWLSTDCRVGPELWGQPTKEQRKRGRRLLQQTVSRFTSVYRKAVSPGYLQDYLDEFSFRHNTASWPDRQTVLDHLLTGLMTTVQKNGRRLQTPDGGDLV